MALKQASSRDGLGNKYSGVLVSWCKLRNRRAGLWSSPCKSSSQPAYSAGPGTAAAETTLKTSAGRGGHDWLRRNLGFAGKSFRSGSTKRGHPPIHAVPVGLIRRSLDRDRKIVGRRGVLTGGAQWWRRRETSQPPRRPGRWDCGQPGLR